MPKQGFRTEVATELRRSARDEKLWEEVQMRAFQGWVNMHLAKRGMSVGDLDKDFADGVKLINLIEILHGQKIEGRYYKNPKSRPYRIDNVNFALTFITDNIKIKLFGCSAEDIVDGNLKIILGMLWRLIQRYQLSDTQNRQSLLQWCREMTAGYSDVHIDNLHDGFADGRAFGALLSVYDSTLFPYESLSQGSEVDNLTKLFDLAEEHMNVPKLLDPKDVASHRTDERSLLTYISMWHDAFVAKGVEKAPASATASDASTGEGSAELEELKKKNATLTEDLEYVREELAITRTALAAAEEDAKEARESLAEAQQALEAAKSSPPTKREAESADVKDEEAKDEEPKDEAKESEKSAPDAGKSAELEEAVAELEAKVAKLQAEHAAKNAELEKITEELETVDAKLKDAVDMESAATTQAEQLNVQIAEGKEKLEGLEKSIAEKEAQLAACDGKLAEKGEKSAEDSPPDALEQAVAAEQRLEEIEGKIKEKEEELKKKERALEVAIKEVNAVTAVRSMSSQSQPDQRMKQELEDAKEEILVLKKKYERAQAKALKKQKKKYESRVKKRDGELAALREQAEMDVKAKDDEIAILRSQLSKAQRALGAASAADGGDTVPNEDLELLNATYTEMLELAKMLEEEENLSRTKQRVQHNSDSEGEEDGKDD